MIPALYRLHQKGRLPKPICVVGFARSAFTSESWRQQLADAAAQFTGSHFRQDSWDTFAANLHYHAGDIGQSQDFASLAALLEKLEGGPPKTRLYYLATLPQLYAEVVSRLGQAGLASEEPGARRIVIEKPFGHDLATAQQLNQSVHQVFRERQVYRIDHYLGKETVQNLLVFRMANSIFEPIWNRNYIDHVQITVAEETKVGRRAAYYDSAGVLRDMFQNHLLQLLMVTAMEAPVRFEADRVRDEKVKVLRAIRRLSDGLVASDTVRGRYEGYLQEPGVPQDSRAATFAAIKLHIENWRWNGVPFYLRSGKAMSCRTTQIVIQFREPPHMLFADGSERTPDANRLVIQIQPAEGIQLHFQTKVPDAGMKLSTGHLDFRFAREFHGDMPDAYQRLLLDALVGDASLFARSDEVELAWGIIDPIIEAWHRANQPSLDEYAVGCWGPESSSHWMEVQGRQWFDVCPVIH